MIQVDMMTRRAVIIRRVCIPRHRPYGGERDLFRRSAHRTTFDTMMTTLLIIHDLDANLSAIRLSARPRILTHGTFLSLQGAMTFHPNLSRVFQYISPNRENPSEPSKIRQSDGKILQRLQATCSNPQQSAAIAIQQLSPNENIF